ncbi:radical SAM/Cys-rich domain protein [bacterium]|nr:radical SAM/Cys-rich domain protein [bacterium]
MQDTAPLLVNTDFPALARRGIDTLQVNLGYTCNLSCTHCHVNAGPQRTETMSTDTADLLIQVMDHLSVRCLDLTGGAPELNADFKRIVQAARQRDIEVIDRCNLTILLEPGQEQLAQFLADQQVTVVASLPCYEEDNVDGQRGKGVYQSSIEALQALNQLGYGRDDRLALHLVYNPTGPFLPPAQESLREQYAEQLGQRYDIVFNDLYTITNMPISRFGAVLLAKNEYHRYMDLLKTNFDAANLDTFMCRDLISVDWQGYLYDCDFNQMLDMPVLASTRMHLRDLLENSLDQAMIRVGDHCYGCTAGQGSSCSGAL